MRAAGAGGDYQRGGRGADPADDRRRLAEVDEVELPDGGVSAGAPAMTVRSRPMPLKTARFSEKHGPRFGFWPLDSGIKLSRRQKSIVLLGFDSGGGTAQSCAMTEIYPQSCEGLSGPCLRCIARHLIPLCSGVPCRLQAMQLVVYFCGCIGLLRSSLSKALMAIAFSGLSDDFFYANLM